MTVNYIALAIPVFFVLMGVEWLVARQMNKKVYRLEDSVNDLSCGILQQLWNIFAKGGLFLGYLWIYEHAGWASLGPADPWAWVLGFFAVDFLYYWFHRLSHEVNFLWAAHIVHHQSEEYNLSVALRQSVFQGVFSSFFYWPLAWLGLHPVVFLTLSSFNTLYQFWIHTRLIGRLGPLEWILNTPSHHRVHHGRNPQYIDRNHGGTLIIWDRLFGTFEPEKEPVVYGITKPLESWNPIWANFHYWWELWDAAKRTRLGSAVKLFLAPPGWLPQEMGGFQPAPAIDGVLEKYGQRRSRSTATYIGFQFVTIILLVTAFIFQADLLTQSERWGFAIHAVWGLTSLGFMLENRRFAHSSEWIRVPVLMLQLSLQVKAMLPASIVFTLVSWLWLGAMKGRKMVRAG